MELLQLMSLSWGRLLLTRLVLYLLFVDLLVDLLSFQSS